MGDSEGQRSLKACLAHGAVLSLSNYCVLPCDTLFLHIGAVDAANSEHTLNIHLPLNGLSDAM